MEKASEIVLEAHAIHRMVGLRSILDIPDLRMTAGKWYMLVGRNGAGKSTLLRILSGLDRPDSGTVRFRGRDLRDWDPMEMAMIRSHLGQHHHLPFPLTVLELLKMARYPHQNLGPDPDGKTIIQGLINEFELENFVDRQYGTLSGGERQRVQLARVLAQIHPKGRRSEGGVLFLDEPLTHLDLENQRFLLDHVRTWNREFGITVISVLHDPNLALAYGDHFLILENGQLSHILDAPDKLDSELATKVFGVPLTTIEHLGQPRLLMDP